MSGNNSVKGVFLRMWSVIRTPPWRRFLRKNGYLIRRETGGRLHKWYQDSVREAVMYQYALRDFESSGESCWAKPLSPGDKKAKDTAFMRRKQFHQRHYICMRLSRIRGDMHWVLFGDGF